jgi:hypothetical protein
MEEAQEITTYRRFYPEETLKKTVKCSYSQLDDVYTLLDDPFNTTKSTLPKYTIEENFVDIYTSNEFIAAEALLKYIRRPKRMSLSAGIGCELAIHTHQEIVEMAIKSILGTIENSRYQMQTIKEMESE